MAKNPWDEFKEEAFTDEDRQKIRYYVQLTEEREPMNRRIVQIYKSWWMLPAGVILAVSGAITGAVDFIVKSAGGGQ